MPAKPFSGRRVSTDVEDRRNQFSFEHSPNYSDNMKEHIYEQRKLNEVIAKKQGPFSSEPYERRRMTYDEKYNQKTEEFDKVPQKGKTRRERAY